MKQTTLPFKPLKKSKKKDSDSDSNEFDSNEIDFDSISPVRTARRAAACMKKLNISLKYILIYNVYFKIDFLFKLQLKGTMLLVATNRTLLVKIFTVCRLILNKCEYAC